MPLSLTPVSRKFPIVIVLERSSPNHCFPIPIPSVVCLNLPGPPHRSYINSLSSSQLFGYKLDYCTITDAVQICPPGLTFEDCPSHFDCYVPCNDSLALQWFPVLGSPYGGMAYCEQFSGQPVASGGKSVVQYWAQVGEPVTYLPCYDDMYQSMLSVFIILTGDNWSQNMKWMMVLLKEPWLPALYTIITMVIGIYTVLNLFLAILLSNLNQLGPEVAATETYVISCGCDFWVGVGTPVRVEDLTTDPQAYSPAYLFTPSGTIKAQLKIRSRLKRQMKGERPALRTMRWRWAPWGCLQPWARYTSPGGGLKA